ncbi:MAG: CopD family protein [Gammaproteobacteria bacterium]|nr:CopD family protein [Gammaproteobacteria bacterium]
MIDVLWLALRAAAFVLLLQAAGTVLFVHACRGALRPLVHLPAGPSRRLALSALAVLAAQVLLEPAHLAGSWEGLSDRSLWELSAHSAAAASCLLRVLGVIALLVPLRTAPAAGALLILGSFLLSGHTVAHTPRALLSALLAVHVSIASFWFGALAILGMLARRLPAESLARILLAFSRLALPLVLLLPAAGLALAVLLLPGAGALRTPYGGLLCTKASLLVLALGCAALNRQRYTPALGRGEVAALAPLRRSVRLEYLLLAGILTATAVLTGVLSPD